MNSPIPLAVTVFNVELTMGASGSTFSAAAGGGGGGEGSADKVRYPIRPAKIVDAAARRSEEHTSELQSLMRISYAVFCLKKKKMRNEKTNTKPRARETYYDLNR